MKKHYFIIFAYVILGNSYSQTINFPDSKFKTKLLQSLTNTDIAGDINYSPMVIDSNGNGEIEVSEAQAVYHLNVQGITGDMPDDLTDLAGIQYFSNLVELNCADNVLTSLDVSALTNLTYLRCDRNNITSLNINGLAGLTYFACGGNALQTLDVSHLVNLTELYCDSNGLANIDVSASPQLEVFICNDNLLQSLDLTHNRKMRAIFCDSNQLSFLDISNFKTFTSLHAHNNPLLTTVIMKFGVTFTYQNMTNGNMNFSDCPMLSYICVDEQNIVGIQNKIETQYNYPLCHVNSFCSFIPGGAYVPLVGMSTYDLNNDGCDTADNAFPNLKFSITTDTTSGTFISDHSGNYSIPLQTGIYTVTPVFESPYFSASPPSKVLTILSQETNPVYQDICITANGIHNDLEVSILPLTPARPGFDAQYQILYSNKGTSVLSGSVSLTFEDNKMDFVSAIPAVTTQQLNLLSWNYTNLMPLETRTITCTININTPMETLPVQGGDQLNFMAVANPVLGDDKPEDNSFGLKQTVVNSFDPNDKTCLEGTVVSPSMIGQYVHYMIRFENTGTFAAENIVVKDVIDTAKFDVSSLVPLDGSHPFVTRITGNNVEFIFENINLPFDEANNDGYVAFKIKTKPTLVVGDAFSNTASIYFDYNFPIVTDPATTIIQLLGNPDFEFSQYFTLYPNPVKNVLNIKTKNGIEMKSASIYNMLGQLVQVSAGNAESIDVSGLASGNYFIKLNSDKGMTTLKFIKE